MLGRSLQTALQFATTRMLFRTNSSAPVAAFDYGLGIDLLPDGLGQLTSGAPVALVVENQASQYTWLRALLCDALVAGPVYLVAEEQSWVDGLLEHEFLQNSHAQGQLTIMLMSPQMTLEIKQHQMGTVLAELKDCGLNSSHALFIMGSHLWLFSLKVSALHRLAHELLHWCAKRQRPVVFGFLDPVNVDELLTRLRNLFRLFPHIAMLANRVGRPALLLERWNGSKSAVFQSRYGLSKNEFTSRLAYDGSLTYGQAQQLLEAPDQFEVIATEAAVRGQRGVPKHWIIISQVSEVASAVTNSIAATILLHAEAASDFENLARAVHHLRMTHPRTLKIVIRETHSKLRANTEQALLRLGANLIVYREVGFSRLLQMIQDINTQTFARDVNPDYERELASFTPDTVRGYQPPAKFCAQVQAVLERTSSIGIKHTLVQLHMLPLLPHLDALNCCTMLRDGDLFTADSDSLHVFLFACQAPDVDEALTRLFSRPLAQLFSSQITDSSEEGIRILLDKLNDAARKGLHDYSPDLNTARKGLPAIAPPAKYPPNHSDAQAAPSSHIPATSALAAMPSTTAPHELTMHPSPIAKRLVKTRRPENAT